jgi:hypothetical protein
MIIEPMIEVIPLEKVNATVTSIDEFLTDEEFPKNAWQGLKEIWQGINEEVPPWFLGLIFCVFYLSVIDCMHNYGNNQEKRSQLRKERRDLRYRKNTKKFAKIWGLNSDQESEPLLRTEIVPTNN